MVKKRLSKEQKERFCRDCLRVKSPVEAAQAAQTEELLALLEDEQVQHMLERGRQAMQLALHREDVLWRLAQLAFGSAWGALALVNAPLGELPTEEADLSAVAEIKRSSSGVMEVKLVDRVKALQVLYELLGSRNEGEGLAELLRIMEDEA